MFGLSNGYSIFIFLLYVSETVGGSGSSTLSSSTVPPPGNAISLALPSGNTSTVGTRPRRPSQEEVYRISGWRAKVGILGLQCSSAVLAGDFSFALDCCAKLELFELLLQYMANDILSETNIDEITGPELKKNSETLRIHSMCRASRVLQMMGNLEGARTVHNRLERSLPTEMKDTVDLLFERANLSFAEGYYSKAMDLFQKICKMNPVSVIDEGPGDFPTLGKENSIICNSSVFPSSIIVASKNLAAASLHCCQIERTVKCLEDLVKGDPRNRLHPAVIFNLCTLYDLAYDTESSRVRKRALQLVAREIYMGIQAMKLPRPGFSLTPAQLQRLGW